MEEVFEESSNEPELPPSSQEGGLDSHPKLEHNNLARLDELDQSFAYNLNPLDAEPFFYRRLSRSGISVWAVFLVALIIPAILVAVAIKQHTLIAPTQNAGVAKDFTSWLFLHPYAQAVDSQHEVIPFLRDYPDLILLVSLVLSIPIVHFLYQELQVVYGALSTNDCLFVLDEPSLKDAHKRICDFYTTWGKFRYLHLIVAFLLTLGVYRILNRPSTFEYWAPKGLKGKGLISWETAARQNWWANSHYHIGAITFILIGTIAFTVSILKR